MHEHESRQLCECGLCKIPQFERNNYFHGKMLSVRDLEAEQRYFNEKRWLINRMVLGWGIVCGLEVRYENGCLFVSPGLALDCCGHELLVCERQALSPATIAEQLGVGGPKPLYDSKTPEQSKAEEGTESYPQEAIPWALCLEYHECKFEQVTPTSTCDSCDDDDEPGRQYNRIRDHYKLTIRLRDDACPKDHEPFCCPYDGLGHDKSIHQVLVEQSRECRKCKECECVLLATGTLVRDGEKFRVQLDKDHWKYRRVVYTNPALANLIRCFHVDLAHITHFNWETGKNYKVTEFLDLLTKDHLKVTFDKPLDENTVKNPRSFRLSIYIVTEQGQCPTQLLIPVDHIDYDGYVATYYFDYRCVEQHLKAVCHSLPKAAEVELILHGNMVLDQHKRALDAELIGDLPTGNGVQGGEFITYFTVGP